MCAGGNRKQRQSLRLEEALCQPEISDDICFSEAVQRDDPTLTLGPDSAKVAAAASQRAITATYIVLLLIPLLHNNGMKMKFYTLTSVASVCPFTSTHRALRLTSCCPSVHPGDIAPIALETNCSRVHYKNWIYQEIPIENFCSQCARQRFCAPTRG